MCRSIFFRLLVSIFLCQTMACDDRWTYIEDYEFLPAEPSKLVLSSLLSPDSVASIAVSYTYPVTTPWTEIPVLYEVDSADVRLYEDSVLVEIMPYVGQGRYVSASGFKPQVNHAYYYIVSAPGYDTAYSLPETVPDMVPITSYAFIDSVGLYDSADYGLADENYQVTVSQVNFYFNDPATIANYYLLRSTILEDTTYLPTEKAFLRQIDGIAGCLFRGQPACVEDICFSGSPIGASIDIIPTSMQYTTQDMGGMYLDLVTITATYYKRAVSYEAYLLTRDHISQEPFNVYSNIQNGYGLVAAYNTNRQLINW